MEFLRLGFWGGVEEEGELEYLRLREWSFESKSSIEVAVFLFGVLDGV